MDMDDVVQEALRAFYVPRDSGFEDVLAELDRLTGTKPAPARREFLRRRTPAALKAAARAA